MFKFIQIINRISFFSISLFVSIVIIAFPSQFLFFVAAAQRRNKLAEYSHLDLIVSQVSISMIFKALKSLIFVKKLSRKTTYLNVS
jgi:hypothetical protein